MKTPFPELNRRYAKYIAQECETCGWTQDNLRREVKSCPVCGTPATGNIKLRFGGMTMTYSIIRNQFVLHARGNRYNDVPIEDADVPDVILFILRNWRPWDAPSKALYERLGLVYYQKEND